MARYVIYLRKSRADLDAESRGEGETLARHKKALLELAKRLKISVTEIYQEIVSGETIASRPVMQQLLSEVEQGLWAGVLVMEVERLARGDTMDQGFVAQAFKYSKTKIITPIKTYNPNDPYDEEFFEFGLFMSRREYKTTTRRLQNGRIASVKEGKYIGNIPPYGYKRKKLEKEKGYTLDIIQDQADIVKMIFELYAKGELQEDNTYIRKGVSLIVRKLNELKVPTVEGDVWVPATVQGILYNPVYIGKIRSNSRPVEKKIVNGQIKKRRPRAKPEDWTLVDGLHKPIIDIDVWELAQEYLKNNPPRPIPSNKTVKNPLSGLILCGVCGRRMVRRPYNREKEDTLMCPITACSNISSKLGCVEDRLLQSLDAWLQDYKMKMDSTQLDNTNKSNVQLDIINKSIKRLDEELVNLDKQMDNIHNLLEQGVYSTEKFLERSKVISERKNTANTSRNELMESNKLIISIEKGKKTLVPKVERIIEIYKVTDSPAVKNELLKQVVEKAVYRKTTNSRWHNNPYDFELELYPKIPK